MKRPYTAYLFTDERGQEHVAIARDVRVFTVPAGATSITARPLGVLGSSDWPLTFALPRAEMRGSRRITVMNPGDIHMVAADGEVDRDAPVRVTATGRVARFTEPKESFRVTAHGAGGVEIPVSVGPPPAAPDAEMCGVATEPVTCQLVPNHMGEHVGVRPGGGYHRWPVSAAPDPVEVGRVVEWAERDAQNRRSGLELCSTGEHRCPEKGTYNGSLSQCVLAEGHDPSAGHAVAPGGLFWSRWNA